MPAIIESERKTTTATAPQRVWLGNGNEAVARAILDIGYDAEGYYPITPSSDVGEAVSKAFALGETDIAFIVGTSELAALGICTGVAKLIRDSQTLAPIPEASKSSDRLIDRRW